MIRCLVAFAAFGVLSVLATTAALAQPVPTPVPVQTETSDPLGDDNRGTDHLGDFYADNAGEDGSDDNNPTPPVAEGPIEPRTSAARVSQIVSPLDEPCAVWSDGVSDGSAVAPLGAEEQASQDAAYEAERRETEGASGDEILDFINGDDGASPMAHSHDTKGTTKSPARQQQAQPEQSDYVPNVKATNDLLNKVHAQEAAAAGTTAGPIGDVSRTCTTPYVCGAERVDDVLAGHIDSEADGVYFEYVQIVADRISAATASIRDAESAPPGGASSPNIPDPSSPEQVQSLAGTLADIGLDKPPSELYLPVFNYCRIGADGDIQTDIDADSRVLPTFTWTLLDDEFDLPTASAGIFEQISQALHANLPDMRTIPPIETGVTIVQFPMWLWLNEPFTYTEFAATSDLNLIRMQGRAKLEHVIWTLGEHEIKCTLDDMRAYPENARLDQVEHPECLHMFTQVETYQMTAAVTYRIEQQISTRRSTTRPFFSTGWEPHPVDNFVTIQSTTGPMRVDEIYSLNVPLDFSDDDLATLGD